MSRDDLLFLLGVFWMVNLFSYLMVKLWERKKD
jgi:hypothetical protein